MKRIFVIDWVLLAAAVVLIASGFAMHIAGHGTNHHEWHVWGVLHVVASVLFITMAVWHVKMHWAWYKGWFNKGLGTKSRVTALLSVVFVLTTATGVVLLFVAGGNTDIGLWHYRVGIALTAISLGHTLKRVPILKKSLQ
ncbi:MAG: DUF4405 domain-containing protein [Alistipes sp.]|nr:DUF4405 domain-containing protein [Alistipes sp.]